MKITEESATHNKSKHSVVKDAEAGLTGAAAGAALGALAGPPGAIAGAVIGSVVGVLAGVALQNGSADEAVHEAELDKEIGVSGGDMGTSAVLHPPAIRGAYSGAASGDGTERASQPAEGPIQSVD